jgi:hypothetical protein
MSPAIDGRLPSRQRELLLTHMTRCMACARSWHEMRAAQELALGLEPLCVGADFRTGLWERIGAGEGAPELALREPIPLASKVRYVAAGAAAAACMLAALHLFGGDDPTTLTTPAGAESAQLAAATGAPSNAPSPIFEVLPVNTQLAAQTGADACATVADRLRRRLPALEERPFPELRREVLSDAPELRSAIVLLRWMESERFLELPAETDAAITLLESVASRATEARDRSEIITALQPLRELDMRKLRTFKVPCCDGEPTFQREFSYRVITGAPWSHLFRLATPGAPPQGFEMLQQNRVFVLQWREGR